MGSGSSSPKYYPGVVERLAAQDGATHVITGTTSGTGFIAARTLAGKGARVICLNRPSARATQALADLRAAVPEATIEHVDCDLMSFESVRTAAAKVAEMCPEGVDALTNNAGVMALRDTSCESFDVQMHVNHLSHFLLTKELWPLLERAAERKGEARVVQHSSELRRMPKRLERRYLEARGGALGGDRHGIAFNGPRWQRYAQSKLANAVFAYALADRLQARESKIKSVWAHPGVAKTELLKDDGLKWNPLPHIFRALMQEQEDGAIGILFAAAGPSSEVGNGDFFGPSGISGPLKKRPRAKEQTADSAEAKAMLWECSEAAIGSQWQL